MKIYHFIFILLCIACGTKLGKPINDYNNNIAKTDTTFKKIAILPAEIELHVIISKKGTIDNFKTTKLKIEASYQLQMYSYDFLKSEEKNKNFSLQLQDISTTNTLLAKNKFTFEDLTTKSKQEICKILNVDLLLISKITTQMNNDKLNNIATSEVKVQNYYSRTLLNIYSNKTNSINWSNSNYQSERAQKTNPNEIMMISLVNALKKLPYIEK